MANPKIKFLWNHVVHDVIGEQKVQGLRVRNTQTGLRNLPGHVRESAMALGLPTLARLRLVELPSSGECCGFGGTFAMKNADTSIAMGSDKARHVRSTGAEVLVAGDNSCLMHVGGLLSRQRSGVRVMHLAEVLAAQEGSPAVEPVETLGDSA